MSRRSLLPCAISIVVASYLPAMAAAAPLYTALDLGTLGGWYSQGFGINSSGQVTGHSATSGHVNHAFLSSGGTMTDLGTLGGTHSSGWGINASGQVSGYSRTPGDVADHAFLYSGGTMIDLGTLGGSSWGYAINANGQVTGESETTGNAATHAFLYSGGTMMDLGSLGGDYSIGVDINASGQVTGMSYTTGNVPHAFLYSGSSMYDLNDLLVPGFGTTLGIAYGINDSGQIVADGSDGHAYLLTLTGDDRSIPEPGSLPLLVAAFGCLAGVLRQKRY